MAGPWPEVVQAGDFSDFTFCVQMLKFHVPVSVLEFAASLSSPMRPPPSVRTVLTSKTLDFPPL